MGIATDLTGLQFRILNKKKGPAVWSPRAQCDKKAYQFRLKWMCESEPNLDVKQRPIFQKYYTKTTRHLESRQAWGFGITARRLLLQLELFCVWVDGHIGSNQQAGGRAGVIQRLWIFRVRSRK